MLRANMPAAMNGAQRPKRAAREKRMSRQPAVVAPPVSQAKSAVTLVKPLAPLPSTKPSDTPMQQDMMRMGKPTAPIAPLPKTPKIMPKPASSKSKQKLTTRPKTGTK